MKNYFIIIHITLLIITLGLSGFGQNKSPAINHYNEYITYNNPPTKPDNTNLILGIVTSIISVCSIFVVWYNVRAQINSVKENISQQFKFQEINKIRDSIAEFAFELSKPDGGRLEENEYVSEKHKEIEKKILSYLNQSVPIEEKLINCLTKFKHQVIVNKEDWLKEIFLIENQFLMNKKQ